MDFPPPASFSIGGSDIKRREHHFYELGNMRELLQSFSAVGGLHGYRNLRNRRRSVQKSCVHKSLARRRARTRPTVFWEGCGVPVTNSPGSATRSLFPPSRVGREVQRLLQDATLEIVTDPPSVESGERWGERVFFRDVRVSRVYTGIIEYTTIYGCPEKSEGHLGCIAVSTALPFAELSTQEGTTLSGTRFSGAVVSNDPAQ